MKSNNIKKEKAKKPNVNFTVKKVMEQAFYDDELNCFVMDDGSYMDLIQVKTKDLVSSADDEVEYDIMKFAKLYKMYADDLKICVMNFPCKTGIQQEYLRHKLKNMSNEVYKTFLMRKLDELVKKKTQLNSNRELIVNTLGSGRNGLSGLLSKEKKIQICERLNNKCFLVG